MGSPGAGFECFLEKAERIVAQLDARLEGYFPTRAPSLVDASVIRSHSAAALSESLYELTRMALERTE